MLKIAYSSVYKYELPEGHRFPMVKYELLPEQLLYEGTLIEDNFFVPQPVSNEVLFLTHTSEYLQKLESLTLSKREIRDIGFPLRPDLISRGKVIANGSIQCALHAMSHGVSINIAGGTHHAFSDHGEGFCIFNDFAIVANYLIYNEIVKSVLIVDLDVHQGNGTAHIFNQRPEVFTWSVHGERNYPLRKMSSDLDIGLADGMSDVDYLKIIKNTFPKLIQDIQPDIVLYLAGVDVLDSDKLGRLSLTREGCKKRDAYIMSECKKHKIPISISMGGGYSHKISDIIEAHANTFRCAQEIFF